MKYKDLINFESVDEIIKFDKLDNNDYRERLVKTFVCSKSYEDFIIPRICKELDLESSTETRGIQIVGNYGTGKSHLMSLFSIIAEDAEYLNFISNDKVKENLNTIAGKYKVVRFEISGTNSLWEMITYQIDRKFEEWDIDYSICDDSRPVPYYDKLEKMMSAFEEKFPDKGFMFVIDEMLSYLEGHAEPSLLGTDLQVLQALGHMSDRTRFRMVFGVQELIYEAPHFQFASDMLSHVSDRYTDLKIEKSDVQFIVQERLLKKNDNQRQQIQNHLSKFISLFPNINNDMSTYVNLYPVHPSYFDNFQQIRIGKSQREVLKTLSRRFESMLEDEVPADEPGLICYDSYWEDMQRSKDLMSIPDVRKVAEITELVNQKIEEWFVGGRAPKKPLAHRIVAAAAIKILQADLSKPNGVIADSLATDLCYVDPQISSFDELVDLSFNTTLNNIQKATIGQYFERNEENLEYHLRIGGVNYKQNVVNYSATMSDAVKDEYFFDFLAEILPVDWNVYKPNFKIWEHTVNWKSHNTRLPGYIFMGHPNARSTTQPQQHFYLYFMPIFDQASKAHSNEEDGIFFIMDDLSEEFKDAVTLYGASQALIKNASSVERPNYTVVKNEYFKSARDKFNDEFIQKTNVEFNGEKRPLSILNPQGESKIDILSNVSSDILETIFCSQNPDYPKFTNLQLPLTPQNRENLLKAARSVIVNPQQNNRNGEAILFGLGLWKDGHLSIDDSQYAQNLKNKLLSKGEGRVLNQSEILELFYGEQYVSKDYKIEADLEFIVMSAMAQLGEIEIVLSGGTRINASTINKILTLNSNDYYTFSNISFPKGINIPIVREICEGLFGSDRSDEIDKAEFYSDLIVKCQELATKAVTLANRLQNGYSLSGVDLLSPLEASPLCNRFVAIKGFCDQLKNYNTKAKLCNIPWTREIIHEKLFTHKADLDKWDNLVKEISNFQYIISYLSETLNYVAEESLSAEIKSSIDKLASISTGNATARAQYMEELKLLKEKYADYYLAAYKASRLPSTEGIKLQAVKDKIENQVCGTISVAVKNDSELSLLNTYRYDDWKSRLDKVRIANDSVTKDVILQTPYQNYNPKAEGIPTMPNLTDLKNELEDIFEDFDSQMKAALEDPSVKENIQMLSSEEKNIFDQYVSGNIKLSQQYVHPILAVVKKLATNFDIEEITIDSLKSKFNRPLDVASAKAALNSIIDQIVRNQQQQGKKYENIRIVIK